MEELVFLGGTSGNNNWRDHFIPILVSKGIKEEILFNPVVKDWNEEAQAREEKAKQEATHLIFYIADPKQEGNPLSTYSMVEATMALYDYPERTVIIFDTEEMAGHPLKVMNQVFKVLKNRFSQANIFATEQEALDWLLDQLQ